MSKSSRGTGVGVCGIFGVANFGVVDEDVDSLMPWGEWMVDWVGAILRFGGRLGNEISKVTGCRGEGICLPLTRTSFEIEFGMWGIE